MRNAFCPLLPALASAAIAGALLLVAPTAAAQPRERGPRAEALDLFEKSAVAYREGRFQDAIDLLLEARRVKPEPVLLYNLGRAHEALGQPSEAADAYERYLAEDPRAADRRAIEGRIATLRTQAAQLDRARTPSAPPPEERRPAPEAPAAEPVTPIAVPWVITGVGLAGVGTGVVLALMADARHDEAVDEPVQAAAQRTQEQAEGYATGATVALVAGGAVTAVGLTWLGIRVLTPSSSSSSSSSAPRVALRPGPGTLTLVGSF